jgi:hypothetical protein
MGELSDRFADLMARMAKSDADLFRTIGELGGRGGRGFWLPLEVRIPCQAFGLCAFRA